MRYLEFERPIVELEEKIERLRQQLKDDPSLLPKLRREEEDYERLLKEIFWNLSAWQRVQIARHPKRPTFTHYIRLIFDEFVELHGDRIIGDDHAIRGGLSRIGGFNIVVVGHDKGTDTPSRIHANFGMPYPEGYRKALRLLRLAEKFKKVAITFIDTPGAHPGIAAEQRGQGMAIAQNLMQLCRIATPIIVVIIGEGGSGGALGIAVGDYVMMLEYAVYSVISPEGCAAILFKDKSKVEIAAENLAMTPPKLLELGIIDEIIEEPLGGAHRAPDKMAEILKRKLLQKIEELSNATLEEVLLRRYERLRNIGYYKG